MGLPAFSESDATMVARVCGKVVGVVVEGDLGVIVWARWDITSVSFGASGAW